MGQTAIVHSPVCLFTLIAIALLLQRIASSLLARFPIADSVQLRCIKPKPPIPGYVSSAGVTIFRSRPSGLRLGQNTSDVSDATNRCC